MPFIVYDAASPVAGSTVFGSIFHFSSLDLLLRVDYLYHNYLDTAYEYPASGLVKGQAIVASFLSSLQLVSSPSRLTTLRPCHANTGNSRAHPIPWFLTRKHSSRRGRHTPQVASSLL